MSQQVAHGVHDPNAIDALRFAVLVAFVWPAIAQRRQPRRDERSDAG
jgi:hypothetical protein